MIGHLLILVEGATLQLCKLMVDKLEEFTLSTLKTNREWIIKIAEDLLLNETIVYKRIKEILPEELENSLICEY